MEELEIPTFLSLIGKSKLKTKEIFYLSFHALQRSFINDVPLLVR